MRPSVEQQINAMQSWYQAMPGEMLLTLEQRLLRQWLANCHGQVAVQAGGPAHINLLAHSKMQQQIVLQPAGHLVAATDAPECVVTHYETLGFVPNAVDLFVAAHVLEFLPEPKQLLSQIYQCLAPHGHAVIFGLSPHSLWAIYRRFHRHLGVPWQGQFYSMNKVLFWLAELGFDIVAAEMFCYQGPTVQKRSAKVRTAFELFGKVLYPALGNAYGVVVQKQIHAYTPMTAHWWAKRESVASGCPS